MMEPGELIKLMRGVTLKLAQEIPETAVGRCQRGADALEAALLRISEQRDLLILTQDTIRDAANDGDESLRELWDKIEAVLSSSSLGERT